MYYSFYVLWIWYKMVSPIPQGRYRYDKDVYNIYYV